MMIIDSKKKNHYLLKNGFLGNTLRTWSSIEELKDSGYSGTVSMRYNGIGGGARCAYNIPVNCIDKECNMWTSCGYDIKLISFNESAPDDKMLIQGEFYNTGFAPYYLYYSTLPMKMRNALKEGGRTSCGLHTKVMLQHLMTPSSLEDFYLLDELYPEHVIEFGTYSINLGCISGRNTIIWEVRKY